MGVGSLKQASVKVLSAGLALCSATIGLGLSMAPVMASSGIALMQTPVSQAPLSQSPLSQSPLFQSDRPEQDGIYLYGESSQPNQLGKGYFIFSKTGSQVVGAIYYPLSEYSCFMGRQNNTDLKVTLVEAGEQAAQGFEVPLTPMYAIARIGESEARVLSACRQEVANLQTTPKETVGYKAGE